MITTNGAQARWKALAADIGYITYLFLSTIIAIMPCGKLSKPRSPLAGTHSLAAPAGSSAAYFAKNIFLWKSIACRIQGLDKGPHCAYKFGTQIKCYLGEAELKLLDVHPSTPRPTGSWSYTNMYMGSEFQSVSMQLSALCIIRLTA
jgi:hypothetical protein